LSKVQSALSIQKQLLGVSQLFLELSVKIKSILGFLGRSGCLRSLLVNFVLKLLNLAHEFSFLLLELFSVLQSLAVDLLDFLALSHLALDLEVFVLKFV